MQARTLQLSDGTELAWREAGQGMPLLFIHGWSVDGSVFQPQLDGLCAHYRVICPDLRGHGASSRDPNATIEVLARDIDALMAALALHDVIAVGWSLGAMVLWQALAGRRASPISGLVTVDMSPMIHNDDDWRLGLRDGRDHEEAAGTASVMQTNWPRMVRQFVPRIFSPSFASENPQVVDDIIDIARRNDVHSLASIWRSMVDQDFRASLASIHVPTLVAYGGRSQLYSPQTAQFVADNTPIAELMEFTRSGHSPHVEEPARFNETIEVFARGVSGGKDRLTSIALP